MTRWDFFRALLALVAVGVMVLVLRSCEALSNAVAWTYGWR